MMRTQQLSKITAHRARERGMTLIEIAVVLIIIGLATGGVLIGVDGFLPENRVRGIAREISAQLRHARSFAWTRGQPHWVEVDLRKKQLRIIAPYLPGSDPLRLAPTPERRDFLPWHELDGADKIELEIWYPDNTKARGDRPVELRFDPRGTFPYHYVVMTDKSAGEIPDEWKYYTLEVRGLTGEVEFYAGLPEIHAPAEADFFG